VQPLPFNTIYPANVNTSQAERLRMLHGAFTLQGMPAWPG
jgi:hypothetical protein